MVPILSLWLPILLSAVLVFVVSSLVHMVLGYHAGDYRKLPAEEGLMKFLRDASVTEGNYGFPHCGSTAEMKSPEFKERFRQGPVGFLSVSPGGEITMTRNMIQWFVFTLVVGAAVAYLTGRTVAPGAEYFAVFRVAGTVAFLTYAGAQPMASIWEKRSWSTSAKHVFDGLLYGLVTAGCFAGFWPDA